MANYSTTHWELPITEQKWKYQEGDERGATPEEDEAAAEEAGAEAEYYRKEIEREEKDIARLETARAGARVHFFDLDFVVILFFAFFIDAVDVILAILGIFDVYTISEIANVFFLDVPAAIVIGLWLRWRTGKKMNIDKQLAERRARLKQTILKGRAALKRATAGSAKGVVGAALKAVNIARVFIFEIIPIIGAMPFWSATVIGTLREK